MQRRPIWRRYPDFFRRAPALIRSLRWCPHQLEGLHGLVLIASATELRTSETRRLQMARDPARRTGPDAGREILESRAIRSFTIT